MKTIPLDLAKNQCAYAPPVCSYNAATGLTTCVSAPVDCSIKPVPATSENAILLLTVALALCAGQVMRGKRK